MRKIIILFTLLIFAKQSLAALPFVTDDAGTANRNQLLVEEFTEIWHLPKKSLDKSANLLGQYLGASYGLTNNLEIGLGALAGYDFSDKSVAFMNPIMQLKTNIIRPKNVAIPSFAISAGYVVNSGQGQYYDNATNAYLMGIFTSRFFEDAVIMHINTGPKASYALPTGKNLYRMQLGIALDIALLRKDFRLFIESYNGSPNSPRDSPGLFHSYQTGLKWIKSETLAFDILYGNQPTFAGYEADFSSIYRRTSTIQIGVRKAIDGVF